MSNEDKARFKTMMNQDGNLMEKTKIIAMAMSLGVVLAGTPAKAMDWVMSVICTFVGNMPSAPWQEMMKTIREVAAEHPESEEAQVCNQVMSSLDLARNTAIKHAKPENNVDGTFFIQ